MLSRIPFYLDIMRKKWVLENLPFKCAFTKLCFLIYTHLSSNQSGNILYGKLQCYSDPKLMISFLTQIVATLS